MSMGWKKQEGGAAFPIEGVEGSPLYAEPGMSMRDWFAGQAVAAGISTTAKDWELSAWFGKNATGITGAEIVAARAYEIADAMIARRNKDRG